MWLLDIVEDFIDDFEKEMFNSALPLMSKVFGLLLR